jgi:osmotically-inducible protein OsmY
MKTIWIAAAPLLLLACSRTKVSDGSTASLAASAGPELGPAIDEAISDRVREAILSDRTLGPDSGRVRVSTTDGIVTLSGSVRDEPRRRRMETLVGSVGSVVAVVNHLVVDLDPTGPEIPMETAVDRAVSDRVRGALRADSSLAADAGNIRVSTQGGIVRLAGAVGTTADRNRATIVASAVGSVVRVENDLAVGK